MFHLNRCLGQAGKDEIFVGIQAGLGGAENDVIAIAEIPAEYFVSAPALEVAPGDLLVE